MADPGADPVLRCHLAETPKQARRDNSLGKACAKHGDLLEDVEPCWGALLSGRALPGVLHDLGNGDALGRVRGEHAFEEVPAVLAHALWLLVVGRHDAREELLQAHQVVAPVVAPLREWQHRCSSSRMSQYPGYQACMHRRTHSTDPGAQALIRVSLTLQASAAKHEVAQTHSRPARAHIRARESMLLMCAMPVHSNRVPVMAAEMLTGKHDIEHDAAGPDVGLLAIVLVIQEDLRRNVIRGPADCFGPRVHEFVLAVAEVAELDIGQGHVRI